jgi:hypothetical protein
VRRGQRDWVGEHEDSQHDQPEPDRPHAALACRAGLLKHHDRGSAPASVGSTERDLGGPRASRTPQARRVTVVGGGDSNLVPCSAKHRKARAIAVSAAIAARHTFADALAATGTNIRLLDGARCARLNQPRSSDPYHHEASFNTLCLASNHLSDGPLGVAVPGNASANVDHLVIGPSGMFVIDSKQWTGSVHQSADGLAWHNHYPLDRTLETVRWEAQVIGRLLGTHTVALLCVHGAHVHGGGLHTQGATIVPASQLRSALGCDRVLSDADVELLATTAWTRLHYPAA